jgi:hypothetical protein
MNCDQHISSMEIYPKKTLKLSTGADVYKKGTCSLTKTIKDRDAKKVGDPHGHPAIYYNVSFLPEPVMQSLIEHPPTYSLSCIYDQN